MFMIGDLDLLKGYLNLNSNSLTVDNTAVDAIERVDGIIFGEDTDFSGRVKWFVGGTTGARVVPFGKTLSAPTPVSFNLLTGTADTLFLLRMALMRETHHYQLIH